MPTKRSDDIRYLWWLVLAAVAIYVVNLLRPILTPFLFGAILAYICNPAVNRLERVKVPRTLGVILMIAVLLGLFALLLLILVPLFQSQVALFLERLPGYLNWLHGHFAPWLKARFNIELQLDSEHVKQALADRLRDAGGTAAAVLPSLKSGGLAVAGILLNLVLVPVVLFYVLRDWGVILARIDELVPRRWHARATEVAREVDKVLGGFLRGEISVMLLMSVYYSTALWLAGLEFALPVGILTGVLVFVPYVGIMVGVTLGTLAALLQFQSLGGVVWVWAAFGVGYTLDATVVTPWLVGDRIGLHPVAVIFAVLAGGQLFGFFGVLLALPVSAALLVGLRLLRQHYFGSRLYRPPEDEGEL
jgi:predicted PurR-regulated permease PerM